MVTKPSRKPGPISFDGRVAVVTGSSRGMWVPRTCVTWLNAPLTGGRWMLGPAPAGAWDELRLVGVKLIFLIVTMPVSLLDLWRREWWWKDAEILMLRHQFAVAERERPRAHSRLTWPDRAWLALLAGTVPTECLPTMRLIVTPGTILRWHRDIVRRRWRRLSRRGSSGRRSSAPTSYLFGQEAEIYGQHDARQVPGLI